MDEEYAEGKATTIEDMIADLEEYYECAGFVDFYERVLKDMSEEQIKKYYEKTFQSKEDY